MSADFGERIHNAVSSEIKNVVKIPVPETLPTQITIPSAIIEEVSAEIETSSQNKHGEDIKRESFVYDIQEMPEGFKVTTPGGFSDRGAIASFSRIVTSREEAEQILNEARADFSPSIELASLRRSFSAFHSIRQESDGKYAVLFPAFRSLNNPNIFVGTSQMSFDNWEEAKHYYLETRNNNEYAEEYVFRLKIDDVNYNFTQLSMFGESQKLADQPLEVPENVKEVLNFDRRNAPLSEDAHTYYKTLEVPNWQGQLFSFVENFTTTPEGQKMLTNIGITDLRLLTPHQAAMLSLEVTTRLKKYNLDEIHGKKGQTESDQNSVLFLLQKGLREREKADYKGNGICRNFASSVKTVFESIKYNQTKFNHLQDTYVFYEVGPQSDFDPSYTPEDMSNSLSVRVQGAQGHAWNSFVTIAENGISQSVVDATWSTLDYDTKKSVKLDYTLQRMEKDVYRNLRRKDVRADINQVSQFYMFLLDSIPEQDGLVLSDEAAFDARNSELYRTLDSEIKAKYQGLSPEKYDEFTLSVYKSLLDSKNVKTKTQFYLTRLMDIIDGKEQSISSTVATELVRLVAQDKQDIRYYDLLSVYALPVVHKEEREVVVKKYVKAWELAREKSYVPPANLVFPKKEIQEAVLMVCSANTREILTQEIARRS